MSVALTNFEYRYLNRKQKWVFVPTKRCRAIAKELMILVRERVEFDPHYYHFVEGGHVAALHALREHRYFGRLDLKNFFYSISRNRVKADLKNIGVITAERYARWSCVPNPYEEPRYSLPYGFPQSPILATLSLSRSALGRAIKELPREIRRSVYLDDIALAADDLAALTDAFEAIKDAAIKANLPLNATKVREPSERIDLFNCDLERGASTVRFERVKEFYEIERSQKSAAAFERYRVNVSSVNDLP